MFNIVKKTISLPDGREILIETGKLARQADGSVVVKLGNTMLLATIVSAKDAREGVDFLPLSVDYQEKFAAMGKIPGGFLRREGRLSDYEVLISRLVDRALRPMFPDDYHAETQINIFLISADEQTPPDALAGLAASAAIAVSDIPIEDYISEVRVGRVNGEYIVNPTYAQLAQADLELMVGASYDNILMVEGELKEVSEEAMLEGIKVAHEAIKVQCMAQKELAELVGKTQKRSYNHETNDPELYARMEREIYPRLYEVAGAQIANKNIRSESFKKVKEDFVTAYMAELGEGAAVPTDLINRYYSKLQKKACRRCVIDTQIRLDGRRNNEIRPIECEVDYLPSTHGSALFTRGETQSLTSATLGTKLDEQLIDGAMISGVSKFILHYNFPSFSTGEIKPNRGPGRREIGHGNLAFRALRNMIPGEDKNPYTIRLVSDILESNGSSSMATVCAGALALMDAGVQISAPVAGIAMGLISDRDTKEYVVLSDILGDEDHLGDMDFKVTGTEKGITATQMDMKVYGLSYDILAKALHQAREGRLHILGKMSEALAEPRPDFKPQTPRIEAIQIPLDMIGAVIGPGGKVVQEIQKTTGATIVIEEKPTHGLVSISATNGEAMAAARKRVEGIVAMPEEGTIYEGIVKSIQPFGAFVEILPGKEGLLHISEIKWERLETMDGVLEVGEEVTVKLIEVDRKTNKLRLSRKALLPKPEGYVERERKPREGGDKPRGDRGGDKRGGGGFNRR